MVLSNNIFIIASFVLMNFSFTKRNFNGEQSLSSINYG